MTSRFERLKPMIGRNEMSEQKRRVKNVYHVAAKRLDSQLCEVIIRGDMKGGNLSSIASELPWDFIPYFVRVLKRAWLDERQRRITQINEIDASLGVKTA